MNDTQAAERRSPIERLRRVPPRAVVAFVLSVLVLPAVLVSWAAVQNTTFSPFDEAAHVDYIRRINEGELPKVGDLIENSTALDIGCRGIAGEYPLECDVDELDRGFIAGGYQYEAQQPPGYYLLTAGAAEVIRIGPVEDLVVAARLAGVLWLSGGLALVWVALRRLGASLEATTLATVLGAISPLVVILSSTVNNDAASMAIGGASLLAFERLRRDETPAAVVVATAGALAVVLIKPLALFAVGAVAVALAVHARQHRWSLRRLAVTAVPPVVASLAGYIGWIFVRNNRADIDYEIVVEALLGFNPTVDSFPVEVILDRWVTYFVVWFATETVRTYETYATSMFSVVGLLVVMSPLFRIVVDRGGRSSFRALGTGFLAMALLAPPALTVFSYVTANRIGGVNLRYGLTLIPILLVGVAHAYDEHPAYRRLALIGTVASLAISVVAIADLRVP